MTATILLFPLRRQLVGIRTEPGKSATPVYETVRRGHDPYARDYHRTRTIALARDMADPDGLDKLADALDGPPSDSPTDGAA